MCKNPVFGLFSVESWIKGGAETSGGTVPAKASTSPEVLKSHFLQVSTTFHCGQINIGDAAYFNVVKC